MRERSKSQINPYFLFNVFIVLYFELSTKKKEVYYCTNILLTYNERQSKINYNKPISPYDNTSFKSRKNGPLSVFDNLKECQEHYIKLIK